MSIETGFLLYLFIGVIIGTLLILWDGYMGAEFEDDEKDKTAMGFVLVIFIWPALIAYCLVFNATRGIYTIGRFLGKLKK